MIIRQLTADEKAQAEKAKAEAKAVAAGLMRTTPTAEIG